MMDTHMDPETTDTRMVMATMAMVRTTTLMETTTISLFMDHTTMLMLVEPIMTTPMEFMDMQLVATMAIMPHTSLVSPIHQEGIHHLTLS